MHPLDKIPGGAYVYKDYFLMYWLKKWSCTGSGRDSETREANSQITKLKNHGLYVR